MLETEAVAHLGWERGQLVPICPVLQLTQRGAVPGELKASSRGARPRDLQKAAFGFLRGSLQEHPKPSQPRAASCRYFQTSQLLAGKIATGESGLGAGHRVRKAKQGWIYIQRSNNRIKTSLCEMLLFHYAARRSPVLFHSSPVTSSLSLTPEE